MKFAFGMLALLFIASFGFAVSGDVEITTSAVCSNSPRPGFHLDEYCNEYCALTGEQCPAGSILNSDKCICENMPTENEVNYGYFQALFVGAFFGVIVGAAAMYFLKK